MKKFYNAEEIKDMLLANKELPKTTNPKGRKRSFIVKVRDPICKEPKTIYKTKIF